MKTPSEHRRRTALRVAAREALRDAARDVPEEGVDWRSLAAGWQIVDRFDDGGFRVFVVRPRRRGGRPLTAFEQRVLAHAAVGAPLKLLSLELDVAISTIATTRRRVVRDLGLTVAELRRFFSGEAP